AREGARAAAIPPLEGARPLQAVAARRPGDGRRDRARSGVPGGVATAARRGGDRRTGGDRGGMWRRTRDRTPDTAARHPRLRRRRPAPPLAVDGGGKAAAPEGTLRARRLSPADVDEPAAVAGRVDVVRDGHR